MTVAELLERFTAYAGNYYRRPDGKQTSEVTEFMYSLRPVNHLFGTLPADDFGPLKLQVVRDLMVRGYDHPRYGPQLPLCRTLINKRVRRIVLAFRWGVSEEIVSESTWHRLKSVKGLKKGRCDARESTPVNPVSVELVEATLPHLTPHVQALVKVELLTGARPGEACGMRLAELDRSGDVWLFRPRQHKTAHHEKPRVLAIGPKAQEILTAFIRIRCPLCGVEGRPPRLGSPDACICGPCADRMEEQGITGPFQRVEVHPYDDHLFSPAVQRQERFEDLRAGRKSKVQPSQTNRKKTNPKRRPKACYDPASLDHAIAAACQKAGLPHWHANQLRHAHGTEVRKRYGLEAAQVALGHSQANVTQVYAERDLTLAVKVAGEIG